MPPDAPSDSAAMRGLPRRLALRPGLHVVRRDDRHLQVGVDPPAVLVVPDDPESRRVLDALRTGARPGTASAESQRLVADLVARGLVVDAAARDTALAAAPDRGAASATYAQFGDDARRRLAARAEARILVEAPTDLGRAASLLRASGVGLTARLDEADTVLVIADEVLSRHRLDPLLRAGLPHLVVAPGPGGLTVGPFVAPGLTACLRCVDAHLSERDPRRSMLLEQCDATTVASGPTPRDPALLALGVAAAVRDVVSYVDGDEPATWSASVTVGPDLALVRRGWRRHPHCGCAWDALPARGAS
jgi:hypothetical protein